MAVRAEDGGVKKASTDPLTLLVLSILAGAFIAFGAIFSTTVTAGSAAITAADGAPAFSAALPYGVVRLLSGVVFSLGLMLVVVAGAELFTGNNLIVMAWASGKVKTRDLLLNWAVAFTGNFVGAFFTAALMFYSTSTRPGRGRWPSRLDDRQRQDLACICSARYWAYVQRTGVSGGLDVLQRTDDH